MRNILFLASIALSFSSAHAMNFCCCIPDPEHSEEVQASVALAMKNRDSDHFLTICSNSSDKDLRIALNAIFDDLVKNRDKNTFNDLLDIMDPYFKKTMNRLKGIVTEVFSEISNLESENQITDFIRAKITQIDAIEKSTSNEEKTALLYLDIFFGNLENLCKKKESKQDFMWLFLRHTFYYTKPLATIIANCQLKNSNFEILESKEKCEILESKVLHDIVADMAFVKYKKNGIPAKDKEMFEYENCFQQIKDLLKNITTNEVFLIKLWSEQ